MGRKTKNKSRNRRSETLDRPPASNPNPTTISPSSALPSAPPITATVPSLPLPPLPPSLLPNFLSLINAAQAPLGAPPPPLSIGDTHQERTSGTSGGANTTADSAGPSTAPSASAASTSTPSLLPITEDFLYLFIPAFVSAMTAVRTARQKDPEELKYIALGTIFSQLEPMESVLETLLELAVIKEDAKKEQKAASDALNNMEHLKDAVLAVAKLMKEKKKPAERGDSCGGSKREGGGPHSGSGGGDGEGGGVCV